MRFYIEEEALKRGITMRVLARRLKMCEKELRDLIKPKMRLDKLQAIADALCCDIWELYRSDCHDNNKHYRAESVIKNKQCPILPDNIREIVDAYRNSKGLSIVDISANSGIPSQNISNFFNSKKKARFKSVYEICNALDITITSLLDWYEYEL